MAQAVGRQSGDPRGVAGAVECCTFILIMAVGVFVPGQYVALTAIASFLPAAEVLSERIEEIDVYGPMVFRLGAGDNDLFITKVYLCPLQSLCVGRSQSGEEHDMEIHPEAFVDGKTDHLYHFLDGRESLPAGIFFALFYPDKAVEFQIRFAAAGKDGAVGEYLYHPLDAGQFTIDAAAADLGGEPLYFIAVDQFGVVYLLKCIAFEKEPAHQIKAVAVHFGGGCPAVAAVEGIEPLARFLPGKVFVLVVAEELFLEKLVMCLLENCFGLALLPRYRLNMAFAVDPDLYIPIVRIFTLTVAPGARWRICDRRFLIALFTAFTAEYFEDFFFHFGWRVRDIYQLSAAFPFRVYC